MIRRRISVTVLMMLSLLLATSLQAASIYRCSDAGGGLRFQDRPCDGAVAATAAEAAKTADGNAKHFFWQASAGKGTLYLLGSIHFGTQEMYPLPTVVTTAFEGADSLVVEANIEQLDPVAMAQMVAEKAIYHDGTTLQQRLSAATWQRLTEVSAKFNLPVELLNQQKPWFVSMSLSALALNRLGYSEELGIDRHFLSQARGRKQIVELESVEWQLNLLDQMSETEQVAMLEETLRELDGGKVFFERMLKAWKGGDANGIQALFDEGAAQDAAAQQVNQRMITDRNKSMTAVLERLASGGGRHFVVVGAGHLSGDEGIIALLKRHGYQVSQH